MKFYILEPSFLLVFDWHLRSIQFTYRIRKIEFWFDCSGLSDWSWRRQSSRLENLLRYGAFLYHHPLRYGTAQDAVVRHFLVHQRQVAQVFGKVRPNNTNSKITTLFNAYRGEVQTSELRDRVVNTPSYSGFPAFESRPEDRPSWLNFFVVFLCPSRQMQDSTLN
jgi:hypothetical protein